MCCRCEIFLLGVSVTGRLGVRAGRQRASGCCRYSKAAGKEEYRLLDEISNVQ